MFCAISGQAPEKAVVSKITGHVYEASLLEKYLVAEGKCPVTGEEMTMDDTVAVQSESSSPRTLPGLDLGARARHPG